MTAAIVLRDGGSLRLFVAPQPQDLWDWRVWHTVWGDQYQFGVTDTPVAAVKAAEDAASELAAEQYDIIATRESLMPGTARGINTIRDPADRSALYSRRICDKVLVAFHLACDQSDREVAGALLRILDTTARHHAMRADRRRPSTMDKLVAAHFRLWHLPLHQPPTDRGATETESVGRV
jgi:hypothetical protein